MIENIQPSKQITPSDLQWIQKVNTILKRNISNSQFNIRDLAAAMTVGERQFRRRTKRITGCSPIRYFQLIRLKFANKILEAGEYQSVSQVAHAVGFDTPYYFSQLYEKYFGKRPSDYFF